MKAQSEQAKIQRGMTFLTSGAVLSNVLYFLRTFVVIRYFGPEKYGILTLLTGIPQFFTLFLVNTDYYITTFLPAELHKRTSKLPERVKTFIWTAWISRSLVWLVISLMIIAGAAPISQLLGDPSLVLAVRIIGLTLAASILQGPVDQHLFNALHHYHLSAFCEILDGLWPLGATLVTVITRGGMLDYLVYCLIGQVLSYTFFWAMTSRYWKEFLSGENAWLDKTLSFEMLRFSYPLTFRRSILEAYLTPLRVLIARVLSYEALGYFSLAYNLYGKAQTLLLVLLKAVMPSLNKALSEEAFLKGFFKVFPNLNFIYTLAFFSLICFSRETITIMAGSQFLGTLVLFSGLALSNYFLQLTHLLSLVLNFSKKTFQSLWLAVVRVVIGLAGAVPILILTKKLYWLAGVETVSMSVTLWTLYRLLPKRGSNEWQRTFRLIVESGVVLAFAILIAPSIFRTQEGNWAVDFALRSLLWVFGLYRLIRFHQSFENFVVIKETVSKIRTLLKTPQSV